jgi:hypothetical protein
MTVSIAIVCEARADHDTACTLADRVLIANESIDWIDAESIAFHREWRGFKRSDAMLLWKDVHSLGRQHSVKGFGHFNGLPRSPDAYIARRALLLLGKSAERPSAVVFQRDADDQPERRHGLHQAREEFHQVFPIIIGFAVTKRECWHLAGFDPINEEESRIFDELRRELGFDPCLNSHELTARHDHDCRSAKRVLRALTRSDFQREAHCLQQPLSLLIERGRDNGLASFLNEVGERLAPSFR